VARLLEGAREGHVLRLRDALDAIPVVQNAGHPDAVAVPKLARDFGQVGRTLDPTRAQPVIRRTVIEGAQELARGDTAAAFEGREGGGAVLAEKNAPSVEEDGVAGPRA